MKRGKPVRANVDKHRLPNHSGDRLPGRTAPNLDAARHALAFIVGSKAYRKNNIDAFGSAVDRIGLHNIIRLAERTHVTGLLYDAALHTRVIARQCSDTASKDIEAAMRYQALHNSRLIYELRTLSDRFAAQSIEPIILKGLGLWGTVYADVSTRRVQDVDLLVSDANILCAWNVLRQAGYKTEQSVETRLDLDGIAHYHLEPLHKVLEVKLDAGERAAFERMQSISDYHLKFEHLDGAWYRLHIDLELHRSVFLFAGGGLPAIPDSFLDDHPILTGYRALRPFANLPYLSAKFALDVEELRAGNLLKLKSLKLLGDVVKLLGSCTQSELMCSIDASSAWSLGELYRRTLIAAASLTLEIDFKNVPPSSKDDTLALFASSIE